MAKQRLKTATKVTFESYNSGKVEVKTGLIVGNGTNKRRPFNYTVNVDGKLLLVSESQIK